jgi:UDP-3-O-[3-hydroxymyristoyl] glucosamine N-acyltransferase
VRIGVGTIVGHGVVLGDDVEIGADVIIYHNVTVYQGCKIGEHVIIHSGTSIGSDGFGFAPRSDGSYEKIPQMGIVVVEDDVEIGANCAIDRATLGETRIKKGAKLDNLIQIAHNVVIGENTVIAAQTGIFGSTKIGKNNMIGGQVGFTGHLEIADNTKFGAQSGVHRSVKESGKTLFGYPAIPHREAARIVAATTQLPEALVTLRELKRTVEVLEERVRTLQGDQIDHPAAKHQE